MHITQCLACQHQSVTDSTGTLAPFYILINVLYTRREESGITFYALTATVKRNTWALLHYRFVCIVVCLRNGRHIHMNSSGQRWASTIRVKIHSLIGIIATSTVAVAKITDISDEQKKNQHRTIRMLNVEEDAMRLRNTIKQHQICGIV